MLITAATVTALLSSGAAVAAVPALTAPSAAAGARLDDHLATELAGAASTDRLRIFVHAAELSGIDVAAAAVKAAGLRPVHRFAEVGVMAAVGTPAQIHAAGRVPGIAYLEADRGLAYSMDTSHQATRGEEALAGFSLSRTVPATKRNGKPDRKRTVTETYTSAPVDGSGVGIAIVDSGVDGTHPMFALPDGASSPTGSRVVRNLKLANACPVRFTQEDLPLPCSNNPTTEVFVDVPTNDTDTPSAGGHGTHVAGIAAGGHMELPDGRVIHGAAPASRVVSLSVGAGISVYGATQAFQWIYDNHDAPCGASVPKADCPPVTVINNSYGPDGGGPFDPSDVQVKYQRLLVDAGVVVVWAAGNDGGNGSTDTTNPPGKDPTPGVISVANYDDQDTGTRDGSLNPTSSRGARTAPDTWPDIAAPGTDITSACRPYLAICNSQEGDAGTISGTSMATPHIVGIVAQLQQAGVQPDPAGTAPLSPAAIEDAIEDTAHAFTFGSPYFTDARTGNPDHASSYDKGHGLVDVVAAVSRLRDFPIGGASTVAPAVSCAGPLVVDGTGDAVHPSTDLTGMEITGNAADGVVFTIAVDDLTADYPETSNGVFFDADFVAGYESFFVSGARTMFGGVLPIDPESTPGVEGTTFTLGRRAGTVLDNWASLEGSFDLDADTVTIRLTPADVTEANASIDENNAQPGANPSKHFPALVDGLILGGVVVNSNTAIDGVVVSGYTPDDTAAATCDAVVGAAAAPPAPPPAPPPPSPSGGDVDATLASGDTFAADGVIDEEQVQYECTGPDDPVCPTYSLQLNPSGPTGTLSISVTTDLPAEDYDLSLYDAAGNLVGSSGNPGTLVESVDVENLAPGVYRLVVQPFLVGPGSPFHVEASLA